MVFDAAQPCYKLLCGIRYIGYAAQPCYKLLCGIRYIRYAAQPCYKLMCGIRYIGFAVQPCYKLLCGIRYIGFAAQPCYKLLCGIWYIGYAAQPCYKLLCGKSIHWVCSTALLKVAVWQCAVALSLFTYIFFSTGFHIQNYTLQSSFHYSGFYIYFILLPLHI